MAIATMMLTMCLCVTVQMHQVWFQTTPKDFGSTAQQLDGANDVVYKFADPTTFVPADYGGTSLHYSYTAKSSDYYRI